MTRTLERITNRIINRWAEHCVDQYPSGFDILEEILHDCDYVRTEKSHWCDGIREYIRVHKDKKGYWLFTPWDQKHQEPIMEQIAAEIGKLV